MIDAYRPTGAEPTCRKTAGRTDADMPPSTAATVAAELLLLRECLARSREFLAEPAPARH